jgi:AcrR family transcriptional regulator
VTPRAAGGLSSRAPGRPRSEQAERAILAAALELLGELGIAGLTMEAVAARAGVAKTTVYRRWSAKEELVLDTLVQLKGPLPPVPDGPVRDVLCQLLNQMRAGWQRDGTAGLIRRLLGAADDHPGLADEYWRRIVSPRRQLLQELLVRGIAAGLIRPDADLDLMVEMLVAPILLRTVIRPAPMTDEQVAEIVDTVLAGAARPLALGVVGPATAAEAALAG